MSSTDTATALVASRAAGLSRDNRKHLIAAIAVAIEDAVAAERERCAAVIGLASSTMKRVGHVDESPAGKVSASILK